MRHFFFFCTFHWRHAEFSEHQILQLGCAWRKSRIRNLKAVNGKLIEKCLTHSLRWDATSPPQPLSVMRTSSSAQAQDSAVGVWEDWTFFVNFFFLVALAFTLMLRLLWQFTRHLPFVRIARFGLHTSRILCTLHQPPIIEFIHLSQYSRSSFITPLTPSYAYLHLASHCTH